MCVFQQIIDEISPRSQDSIVGTGERLACKIVAAALRDRGIDSELVVLDSIVDATVSSVTDAALTATGDQGVAQLGQEFYDQLSVRLGERIRECGERVPVITGESIERRAAVHSEGNLADAPRKVTLAPSPVRS